MNKNNRLVILGGGFISTSIKNYFNEKGKKVLLIRKKRIDLSKLIETKGLSKIIKKDDIIFFSAAFAPVKNKDMYNYNIKIAKNFSKIIKKINFSKMIYLSSDAVYSDSKKKINEKSPTKPNSFHGQMHLTRENIFKKKLGKKLVIVRPTLVYGPNDPHNGYGPNKFIREAKKGKHLKLFGKGEERRDHIFINDLTFMIYQIINKNFIGTYNLASGKVISFNQIAKIIKYSVQKKINLIYIKRNGPMPHKGYRAFNISKIKKVCNNLITKKISKYFFDKLIRNYN